jgi:hypothetical protein
MWLGKDMDESLEHLRAMGAAYTEIRKLGEKYRHYQDFKESGGSVNRRDHVEISEFIRDVPEENNQPGVRELIIEDLDRMGRDIAFYLRRSCNVGISLPQIQGYLLPVNLAEAQMAKIVGGTMDESNAELVVLRHDDKPIVILYGNRIEKLLEKTKPDILRRLKNVNKEDQEEGGPRWLQEKPTPEQQDESRQERFELLTNETIAELMQLLVVELGEEVRECDQEGLRPYVESLVIPINL